MTDKTLVTWHEHRVQRKRGCVVWLTGLSGSGKSTIANHIDFKLHEMKVTSYLLDGDNVRHGLNASPERLESEYGSEFANRFGLSFAANDRSENIRRIGCVADLFCSAGIVTLTAFVSPYRKDRQLVRDAVLKSGGDGDFVEVFVDTPLEICESRDPKGLYKKARAGEIVGFTGIDDPYEPPERPEIHLASGTESVEESAGQVIEYLKNLGKIGQRTFFLGGADGLDCWEFGPRSWQQLANRSARFQVARNLTRRLEFQVGVKDASPKFSFRIRFRFQNGEI